MDTTVIISDKIVNYYGLDKLEILLSVKSALTDTFDCPWIIINTNQGLNDQIKKLESFSFSEFRSINEKNLKKLNTNFLEIHLLPKNKKIRLNLLVDDLINDESNGTKIIFDHLKIDPFSEDKLYNFIIERSDFINQDILISYKNRNQSSMFLKEKHDSKNHFQNCFEIAKKQKIKFLWKTTWSKIELYSDKFNFVENLIL